MARLNDKPSPILRPAVPGDIPAITALYDAARRGMREQGIDQWQDGYPNEETARADIARGISYVAEEAGALIATAAVYVGHEPTYDVIYDGAWGSEDREYGVIHRIAVSPDARRRGAASAIMDLCARLTESAGLSVLRCDTHRDNAAMRRTLEKNGYVARGVIRLTSGALRVAYERRLKDPRRGEMRTK